jgi:hypothetical protein
MLDAFDAFEMLVELLADMPAHAVSATASGESPFIQLKLDQNPDPPSAKSEP